MATKKGLTEKINVSRMYIDASGNVNRVLIPLKRIKSDISDLKYTIERTIPVPGDYRIIVMIAGETVADI